MTLTPGWRKVALTVHVTTSVGWLGTVGCFLALAVVGVTADQPMRVRAAYVAADVTARYVIVPLAFAALATGVLQSLGTTWGLFRYYWVVVKLVVTVAAVLVLLQQLAAIDLLARTAARTALAPADLTAARASLVVHAAGGLVALLVPTVLSVYKPRGLTRYGARRQRQERTGQQVPVQ